TLDPAKIKNQIVNAGGGTRMQLSNVIYDKGRIFCDFYIVTVFNDASIRATSENAGDKNIPQVKTTVRLEYKNGKFIMPKKTYSESKGKQRTNGLINPFGVSIKEARELYKQGKNSEIPTAYGFTHEMIKQLVEQDGMPLAVLFRSMMEINTTPESLSIETIFFYRDGKLTVKVIDFDGLEDDEEKRDLNLAFRNYAMRSLTGAKFPIPFDTLSSWEENNPSLKQLLDSTIRHAQTTETVEVSQTMPDIFSLLAQKQSESATQRNDAIDFLRKKLDEYKISDSSLPPGHSIADSINESLDVVNISMDNNRPLTFPIYLANILKSAIPESKWNKTENPNVELYSISPNMGLIRISIAGLDFVYCIKNDVLVRSSALKNGKIGIKEIQDGIYNNNVNLLDDDAYEKANQIFRDVSGEFLVQAVKNDAMHEGG
ncbi:MAG: hypothetical protein Q7R95_06255, partial [bacterium]|nr:hypothetical protein [bacterium]